MKTATKNKAKKAVKSASKTATKVAKKTGEFAVKNPETILYVLGGIIVIVAGVKIYKTLTTGINLTETHLPDLQDDPNQPISSLNDVQAQLIAERLYAAMSTTFKANKNEVAEIFDALTGLNVNDFLKVYDAFGARQYSLYWSNVGDPITSDKHNLLTWLGNELNTNDQARLVELIPGLNNKLKS